MKQCPQCAEQVQDDANTCRYCRHNFAKASGNRALAAVVIVGAIAFAIFSNGGDRQTTTETLAERPQLSATVKAQCANLLSKGEASGVIKSRPAPNRLNVEDALWKALPANTKQVMLQAVSCEAYGTNMPSDLEHVVAYGHRSGKRIAMLTSVGIKYE